MGGVIVHDGRLAFTANYALEWSILSRGAAGARKHIASLEETATDEGTRRLLSEMSRTPAIVPTDREEIYSRAYGLIREAGQGLWEELRKIGYPPNEMGILDEAFLQGFIDTSLDREDAEKNYIGAARLFYSCGGLVANVTESIFPEDENEPRPDFKEVWQSFQYGLCQGVMNE